MVLAGRGIERYELAATLVNALAHHQSAVDPNTAMDHVITIMEKETPTPRESQAWLLGHIQADKRRTRPHLTARSSRRAASGPHTRSNCAMGVRRPDWWDYPAQCEQGHPWEPGQVLVGWLNCTCPPVVAAGGPAGHTVVYCRAEGCPSRGTGRATSRSPANRCAAGVGQTAHQAASRARSRVSFSWARCASAPSVMAPRQTLAETAVSQQTSHHIQRHQAVPQLHRPRLPGCAMCHARLRSRHLVSYGHRVLRYPLAFALHPRARLAWTSYTFSPPSPEPACAGPPCSTLGVVGPSPRAAALSHAGGHQVVSCRAEGCWSRWHLSRHEPGV